ncbi:MAG: SWIM zinc finger domain-containing protein [Eubacteriales bacterium]
MGLLECASAASVWRGRDYYEDKKVKNLTEISNGIFTADVIGTASEPYVVNLDVAHPRKSTCNCPHADGKRIVCKHIVATYFTAYPEEVIRFDQECLKAQEEEEAWEEELYDRVQAYVGRMKKNELQQALLELLFDGPEWQFERFVRDHDLDEY